MLLKDALVFHREDYNTLFGITVLPSKLYVALILLVCYFNCHLRHFQNYLKFKVFLSFQLFENGMIIPLVNLEDEYELTNDIFFQLAQLKNASSFKMVNTNF